METDKRMKSFKDKFIFEKLSDEFWNKKEVKLEA